MFCSQIHNFFPYKSGLAEVYKFYGIAKIYNCFSLAFWMAERVSTGGTREFIHDGEKPSLSDEERNEIRGAYDKYYERRRIERKKRRNIIIAFAILIILIILFFVLRAIF